MNIPLMITILVILLIMSAFFSATETAFTSFNRTRVKSMADDGNKKAARILRMSEKYDRLLTTVLVGNNIVNITSTTIATVLFTYLWHENGPLLSTVVMTLLVLIFGEICPKSIAKERPEKFAMAVAPLLQFLITVLTPIVMIFLGIKKLVSIPLFHKDSEEECAITESEILTFVEEAEQEGGIDEQESELIKSAIEFNDLNAEDILTPRVDIVGVPTDAAEDDIEVIFADCGFSRLPVFEDTVDNIVGILHQKDFYKNSHKPITELMQKPTFIAPNMKVGDLLRLLQEEKTHMAIIADEFGGTLGIVTMEDILEELVGDIYDEHDEVVEVFTEIGENLYRIDATAELDDMFDFLNLEEIESESTTVSGWVVSALEKIPEVGDSFESDGLAVKVTETDSRRVLAIEVSVIHEEKEDEEEEE